MAAGDEIGEGRAYTHIGNAVQVLGQFDEAISYHQKRLKIAQKLGEEAVETVIEAIKGRKGHLIEESADLLYFLLVTWKDQGIEPEDVWKELTKRHKLPEAKERAGRLD